MPPTFGLKQTPHPDKILLHNTGCFVADLRKPVFWQTDDKDRLRAWFDFPTGISRDEKTKRWKNDRESEDWFFSRQLHELGAKTYITRKVRLGHGGLTYYRNDEEWGSCAHDEDCRSTWEPDLIARGMVPPAKPESKSRRVDFN